MVYKSSIKGVIILSLKIITPEQLADNIKNNVRYKPVDTGDNDMDGFINAFNRAVDQYMFTDDNDEMIDKARKYEIFHQYGEVSLLVNMMSDNYLTPTYPEERKLLSKYQKYIEAADWDVSYRVAKAIIKPQSILVLTAHK